jgi:NAD(P)-dependent dehydrogenase (short-subunit alcohol dehydrogenase family)
MGGRLADKVAIVTGGGGGIGRATGELFLQEGASVALVDSDAEAATSAGQALDPSGERVLAVGADLADEAEAARIVRETVARFGRLDVLVNGAGVRAYGPITEATPESWERIIGVNLLAAAYCSQHAVPELARAGGGTIVNVSSTNAVVGRSGLAQYDATKAALLGLTRSMACDHADQGIRVNAVCPGFTATGYHVRRRAAREGTTLEQAESGLRSEGADCVLGRLAEPREIAYAILFLACGESSYITGATLMVDGGTGMQVSGPSTR